MRKDLRNDFLRTLGGALVDYGFDHSDRFEGFIRETDGRVLIFYVKLLVVAPGFKVEPAVGIRFEQVEDIFHRSSGFEPEYQGTTPTIGAGIGELTRRGRYVLALPNMDAISGVVSELTGVFTSVARPYYEAYGSLAAVDAALNEHPETRSVHRASEWLRASTGLIVARLVGRSNYSDLVAIYRRRVAKMNSGFYSPQYEALVQRLDQDSARSAARSGVRS